MKKVFWTSVVWIILIGGFSLYMKWFNQPLADQTAAFLSSSFPCPVLQCDKCDTPVCQPCECDTKHVTSGQNNDMTTYCAPYCDCPESIITGENLENWTNLFEQLNRIEKNIKTLSHTGRSEQELFEEFKTRYSQNN